MISIVEAVRQVVARAQARSHVSLPLLDAHGWVAARDVLCTFDSPPHDKSLVDGYAVRASEVNARGVIVRILEEVTAGKLPRHVVVSGAATRIMTGRIPDGADAVVMVERTEVLGARDAKDTVQINEYPVRIGQNIMRRGEAMRVGEIVLKRGARLRAIEIGLLAELGLREMDVFARPTVSVIATGDELVPFQQLPAAGQIRNTNGPLLELLVKEANAQPRNVGIARDNEPDLARLIQEGLTSDVLLLSGGVSAGVLDLVPNVLKRLGVVEIFHKVDLKPGKPLWFGVREDSPGPDKLVFGLPGNPVSALVCFLLFVRPALARLSGHTPEGFHRIRALLAKDHHHRSDRPTYYPGRSEERNGELLVDPLDWHGSSDLRTLVQSNVLIEFPAGEHTFRASEPVWVYLL